MRDGSTQRRTEMMTVQCTEVPAGQLHTEGPLYQPLMDVLLNDTPPDDQRVVGAGELRIAKRFRASPGVVELFVEQFPYLKMHSEEWGECPPCIPVMQRSDGSLWVYDDCALVEAAQRVDPNTPFVCFIFRDPTK
jgi:hypothetical protein